MKLFLHKMLKEAQEIAFDFTQTVQLTGNFIQSEYYTNPHDPLETYCSYHSNHQSVISSASIYASYQSTHQSTQYWVQYVENILNSNVV